MRALILAVALATTAISTPAAAAMHVFEAALRGASEAPPNASPGTGFATVTFDDVAQTMRVQTSFQDLTAGTTAAHIHVIPLGSVLDVGPVATTVPSFVGFPSGVTSGAFDSTLDVTSLAAYNPSFITGNGGTTALASAALLGGLQDRRAYFNIHTTAFPGGEIRGFLTAIPEPASWGLMIAGFGLSGVALRLRRRLTLRALA